MKRLLVAFKTSLFLAACSSPPHEVLAPDFEQLQSARLGVINQQDVERELRKGPACALSANDQRVLVAVEGDAITRPANNLIHLQFTGANLYEGGIFSRGDFSIAVTPIESHGTVTGKVTERRVAL